MRITRGQLRRIIREEARRNDEVAMPTIKEFYDFSDRISIALEALGRNDSESEDPYLWEVFDVPLSDLEAQGISLDELRRFEPLTNESMSWNVDEERGTVSFSGE